jgi:hypothetical protein
MICAVEDCGNFGQFMVRGAEEPEILVVLCENCAANAEHQGYLVRPLPHRDPPLVVPDAP